MCNINYQPPNTLRVSYVAPLLLEAPFHLHQHPGTLYPTLVHYTLPWYIIPYPGALYPTLVHYTLPWCIIPYPGALYPALEIITPLFHRIENNTSHLVYKTQCGHILSAVGINNNVIIYTILMHTSTTGTFYPDFSILFP